MATAKTIQQLDKAQQVQASDLLPGVQNGAAEAVGMSVAQLAQTVGELNADGPLAELELAVAQGKAEMAAVLTNKGQPTTPAETLTGMAQKMENLDIVGAKDYLIGPVHAMLADTCAIIPPKYTIRIPGTEFYISATLETNPTVSVHAVEQQTLVTKSSITLTSGLSAAPSRKYCAWQICRNPHWVALKWGTVLFLLQVSEEGVVSQQGVNMTVEQSGPILAIKNDGTKILTATATTNSAYWKIYTVSDASAVTSTAATGVSLDGFNPMGWCRQSDASAVLMQKATYSAQATVFTFYDAAIDWETAQVSVSEITLTLPLPIASNNGGNIYPCPGKDVAIVLGMDYAQRETGLLTVVDTDMFQVKAQGKFFYKPVSDSSVTTKPVFFVREKEAGLDIFCWPFGKISINLTDGTVCPANDGYTDADGRVFVGATRRVEGTDSRYALSFGVLMTQTNRLCAGSYPGTYANYCCQLNFDRMPATQSGISDLAITEEPLCIGNVYRRNGNETFQVMEEWSDEAYAAGAYQVSETIVPAQSTSDGGGV